MIADTFSVQSTTNINDIKFLVCHPDLFELAAHVGDPNNYIPDLTKEYILIRINGNLAGLFVFEKLTAITVLAHCYILPRFQIKHSIDMAKLVIKWLNKFRSHLTKIVLTVPDECHHVKRFATKLQFTNCGQITKGIIYKNKTQDLVLFELAI